MKLARFMITAVVVGMSAPAFAQGQGGNQAVANTAANQAPATTTTTTTTGARGWMASGYIGTNFAANRHRSVDLGLIEDLDSNASTSFNWGGQVGYLGRGVIGGEFLMDFSPSLSTFNNVLFERSPDVNSYMFNLIAAAPFGSAQSYDPYISGGIGVVTLNSNIFTVNPLALVNPNVNTLETQSISGSKFGWDIGGGLMAWSERNWGFRADVRYYRTTSNNTDDVFDINNIGDGDLFSRVELSGISFWKANVGLSYRW